MASSPVAAAIAALPVTKASAEDVLLPALQELPECSETVGGLCLELPPSSKGVIVYSGFKTCAQSFINLPGINLLPTWLLAVMWGLFLLWLFFGVAVISDSFVEGIEVITSAEKVYIRKDKDGNDVKRKEPVWNWAVANITLLAVGSSSPEILLSLVETLLTLGSRAGDIGPSTIIGSGSYNLFVIIAVCTLSLPYGTIKRVEHYKVFWWTTSWSMWAHLWLWIVYKQITPDRIEVWEAWVTLGMTPIFVYTTWLVDTRGFRWWGPNKNAVVPIDDENIVGDDEDEEKGAEDAKTPHQKLADPTHPHHSILYYRSLAVQQMAGHVKADKRQSDNGTGARSSRSGLPTESDEASLNMSQVEAMNKDVPKVLTKSPEVAVLESVGVAKVSVVRMHGDMNSTLTVEYETKDGTAVAGLDYVATKGKLVFPAGCESQDIEVTIMDDDMSEPDVKFEVLLSNGTDSSGAEVSLLRKKCSVTIVDDDDSGIVMFELPTYEAGVMDQYAQVVVIRRSGTDGRVSVDYKTSSGSATAGTHFKEVTGSLEFKSGDTRKTIQVPLLPFTGAGLVGGVLAFRMQLSNPMGGLVLGQRKECRIVMVPGVKMNGKTLAAIQEDGGEEGSEDEAFDLWGEWQDQFQEALMPEFEDEEDMWTQCILHYMSVTYKLIAAFCPPPEYMGGYPCFIGALILLGCLMAIVKEVAQMFGCALGLSELMTGMSVVALGTSLPDTFASRYAAINDDNADAAIGNIMGSNTANVLLGLGVPWVVAACYYEARSEPYVVSAGALGFSIMVFFILAAIGLVYLTWLRFKCHGELGGSKGLQWGTASFFVGLWLLMLLLSGLYDYGHIPEFGL